MARPAADPDTPEHQAAYHSAGMSHFMDMVAGCQALAFLRFTDGAIGAGVGLEIARALQLGLPTFDISAGRLEPVHVLPVPLLSREQTRERTSRLLAEKRLAAPA
jgi:hypothetical protein